MPIADTASYGIMSLETLEAVLRQVLTASAQSCAILFQGGEPTLAGLPFFQEAVRLSRQLNRNGCRISFALQTNGLLIDEDWCQFLAENRFLVGVSLDGTKDIHDANRVDALGNGTYSRVMHALQLLRNYRVDTNILTVITSGTAQSYQKIHDFYAHNGYTYQQYIPCLDPLGEERGQHSWSLTPPRRRNASPANGGACAGAAAAGTGTILRQGSKRTTTVPPIARFSHRRGPPHCSWS